MFAAYTPIDRCIGKEITVQVGEQTYTGMLAGTYVLHGVPVLVITPMDGGGAEQHIPLQQIVITVRPDQ